MGGGFLAMIFRQLYLILILLFAVSFGATAQTVVSGSVENKEGEPLSGTTVIFTYADTVAGGTFTDSKGRFELKGLPMGDYECRVSMLGYKTASQKFKLVEKTKLPKFVLEEDATMLGEVSVIGDVRKMTKELAGMSIYYLTDRAKKEPNAYMALREIPRLRVNEANRSITLDNGTAPLILVDGVKKPLDVLNPEFIESVEVIDNPSARYRGDTEVASVLNIKLKKEGVKPYLRSDIGVNSMLNANFFYSSASFEMGTATSSLYLNGGYMQYGRSLYESHSIITQGDIQRDLYSNSNGYWRNPFFNLGGDKVFSKKNYLAFSVKYIPNPQGTKTSTEGEITDISTGETSLLTSFNDTKTRYHELVGNLYYKHSFTDSRILELTGNYYYSLNGNTTNYEETSELMSYLSGIDQDNSRHMGKLDANYSDMLTGTMHLDAGSNTEYSVTNIDDRLDTWPVFRYRRTREYLYAGIDNNRSQSKFNYVLSLGLDMAFSDADGVRNEYIDFVPSVSLAYMLAKAHRVNLTYNRSRQMPSAGALNPRNTSTNKLYVVKGNPLLKPSHTDNVKLGYVFSNGTVRVNPYISYTYNSDLVTSYGYLEDDNVYVSTYQNFGHFSQLHTGAMLSYNFPQKNGFYGNMSFDASYNKMYMKGMAFRGSTFNASLQGFVGFRKVSANAYFGYYGNSYSLYSKMSDNYFANFNLSWTVSPSVMFQFMAENFICPRRASKTWTVNGDYEAFTRSVRKSLAPKIQIGVWFTFQTKNFKWRNKKQFYNEDGELKTVKTR